MKPALLFIVLVLASLVWFAAGARPQHWDSAIHLTESLNASRIGEDTTMSAARQALFVSWYYPPLVSYASIPFYKIFGESELTGLLVMCFFLGILVFSTYALGARLFDEQAGFLAALMVASYPIVIEFSHTFMLDLPLASMVALTVLLLVRSENFSRLPCSLLAGLAVGCGMLTKWTFPLFVLGPALFAFSGALKGDGKRRRRIWTMAGALLVAVCVALPWYLVHAVQIITSRGGELRQEEFLGLQSFLYYLKVIPLETSWLLAAVLALGVMTFFLRVRTHSVFLLVWFAAAYVLLSLIGFKMPRFAISLLIPLTLMASGGIVSIFNLRGVRATLFALCGVVFLAASFVPAESAPGKVLAQPVLAQPFVKTDGPVGDGWHQKDIAERVAADARARGADRVNVRVVPDLVYCNGSTLEYHAKLLRLPLNVAGISAYPLFTDYAVVTTGRVADAGVGEERGALTERILKARGSIYSEVARWPLPDGSEVILLRLDPTPADGVTAPAVVTALRASAEQFVRKYLRPVAETSIDITEYSPAETRRGRIREIRVRSAQADLGDFAFTDLGMRVTNVDCSLRDLQIDVKTLLEEGKLDVYAIKGAEFRKLRLSGKDLADYAERSAHLSVEELVIDNGSLTLRVVPKDFGRRIDVRIILETLGGRDVGFSVQELSVAGIPIPAALVNTMTSPFTPLLSGLRSVPDVRLGRLVLSNDALELR